MNSLLIALEVLACAVFAQCVWIKEMENPGLFEGDIVLDPDERVKINRTHVYCSFKGGRWPGAKVPYVITRSIGERGVQAIHSAIEEYHKHTCIRFHKRTNEAEYISFYRGNGCNSPIGYRRGRVNHISLAAGCWWTGTTVHEIGHSMGFDHEQNRPDRDKYVDILWNNIQRGLAFAFYKQPKELIDSLGTPYDLESTMHYGTTAFGIGGRQTIRTKDPSKQGLIRDNRGFSKIDIIQLNLMYCKGATLPPWLTTDKQGHTGTWPPTQAPACDDKSANCPGWARQGYCTRGRYAPWMKRNCCKSCKGAGGGGGGGGGDCDNKNPRCEEWAKRGECGKNPGWMLGHCCKACKGR